MNCKEEDWELTIQVNLKGVWLSMKYEIAQMLKQSGGAIVNTSSAYGLAADGGSPAYVASKHGVIGLTKTAALEYGSEGIRVNAVCPGLINTPMNEPALTDPQLKAQMLARHPIGRIGNPEEVAQAVVWLCSDAASFVTGHAMTADPHLPHHRRGLRPALVYRSRESVAADQRGDDLVLGPLCARPRAAHRTRRLTAPDAGPFRSAADRDANGRARRVA